MDHPPSLLLETQTWFGHTISQNPNEALLDAEKYIAPNALLNSTERLSIYKQGYWDRLLNILRETFPALRFIMGTKRFDEDVAIPYLSENVPSHWSLAQLGNTLSEWIKKNCQDTVFFELAEIDYAYRKSYSAKELPEITFEQLMNFPSQVLVLQPHITLISHQYDYTQFREQLFEQTPEYWQNHPLPELTRQQYYGMIWRDYQQNTGCLQLEPLEFVLLEKFSHGITLEYLCAWLDTQPSHIGLQAQGHLQNWMQKWTINAWLSKKEEG